MGNNDSRGGVEGEVSKYLQARSRLSEIINNIEDIPLIYNLLINKINAIKKPNSSTGSSEVRDDPVTFYRKIDIIFSEKIEKDDIDFELCQSEKIIYLYVHRNKEESMEDLIRRKKAYNVEFLPILSQCNLAGLRTLLDGFAMTADERALDNFIKDFNSIKSKDEVGGEKHTE